MNTSTEQFEVWWKQYGMKFSTGALSDAFKELAEKAFHAGYSHSANVATFLRDTRNQPRP